MNRPGVILQPAIELPSDDLVALLNRAFADYIVPLQLSRDAFDAMVERDDILLDASFIAFATGQPVGLALVAVRPWRAGSRTRLAAMGVTPEGRRAGIGRALLARVVAGARACGSDQVVLEVFTGNTAARRLYETHDFVAWRELRGYTLPAAHLRTQDPSIVRLRPIAPVAALPLFAACTSGEAPEAMPSWQVDAPSLARLQPPTSVYAIEAHGAAQPAGYLAAGDSATGLRLLHLGILPQWRRQGIGTAALGALLAAYPQEGKLLVAPLVPAASPLVPFLEACGATQQRESQQEMILTLRASQC